MVENSNLGTMYKKRRDKLLEQVDQGVVLISSSGMSPDPFLYDKNLLYLTGQRGKETILLMSQKGITLDHLETLTGPELGRGKTFKEILFVPEQSQLEAIMDGETSGTEAIKVSAGIEAVYNLSKLNDALASALIEEEILWVNVPAAPVIDKPLNDDLIRINKIRERFPWLRIKNIAPDIHDMRRIKEPYEIDCLRKAFVAHTQVYEKIMATLKPGDNESKGEAIWEYETLMLSKEYSGRALDLYASQIIVATGKNAAIPHYMDNNQEIKDGDLVLMDTGVDYMGYSSDITRTFPANGRFTPRQKQLYEIVLEAQKQAIDTMKPGSSALDAHRAVYEVLKKHDLEKHGFGACGHPVGLNIHDANQMHMWVDDRPFEPGVVLVIEPILNLPEESIGIRIEDGVLITENGIEMMPGPPKEVDEVEELCRRD